MSLAQNNRQDGVREDGSRIKEKHQGEREK